MELRQLEYLVAVAEEANFTRAAERVRISQSGVSAQIRQLEHELGVELIDRSTRRASLTSAGEAVLEHARAALAAAGAARQAADDVTWLLRGRLAVGMVTGCSTRWPPSTRRTAGSRSRWRRAAPRRWPLAYGRARSIWPWSAGRARYRPASGRSPLSASVWSRWFRPVTLSLTTRGRACVRCAPIR